MSAAPPVADFRSLRFEGTEWLLCGKRCRDSSSSRLSAPAALLSLPFQGWATAISLHLTSAKMRRPLSGRPPHTAAQQEREMPFEIADFRGLPLLLLSSTTGGTSFEPTVSQGGSPRPATNASRSETRIILRRPIKKVATGNLPAESQFFAV